jgi:hypothetical protein
MSSSSGWRASATAMRMMTRTAPIAAIRRDTGSAESPARISAATDCDFQQIARAEPVQGRLPATSVDSITLSDGEGQGERSPSRRSARSPGPRSRSDEDCISGSLCSSQAEGNHRCADDVRRDAAERLSVVIPVARTPRHAGVPWRRPGPRPAGTLRLPSGCAIRAGCHRRTAPSLRRPAASRCPRPAATHPRRPAGGQRGRGRPAAWPATPAAAGSSRRLTRHRHRWRLTAPPAGIPPRRPGLPGPGCCVPGRRARSAGGTGRDAAGRVRALAQETGRGVVAPRLSRTWPRKLYMRAMDTSSLSSWGEARLSVSSFLAFP